jgi:hypothetical protein
LLVIKLNENEAGKEYGISGDGSSNRTAFVAKTSIINEKMVEEIVEDGEYHVDNHEGPYYFVDLEVLVNENIHGCWKQLNDPILAELID